MKPFREERMPIDCLILYPNFPYAAGDTACLFYYAAEAAERGTYD